MMLMRDLLDGRHGDLFGELTLVAVPLFNPDGDDAIDPANRRLDLPKPHGQLLTGWYGNFVEDERSLDAGRDAEPAAAVTGGWMTYTHHPRFGSNYRGLTGRLDLLLECYSYLPFADRVRTTYACLLEALRYTAGHRDEILQLVAASRTPRDRMAIRYRLDAFDEPIEVPTRTPRTLDGTPSTAQLRYFGKFVGTNVIERPPAYLVDATLAEHLARHGLAVEPAPAAIDAEVMGTTPWA